MKLTLALLTAVLLHGCTAGVAQNVTFSGKDVPLSAVFASVKNQTGFLFVYTDLTLKFAKPVTIIADGVPLEQFLSEVFKDQPLIYEISGMNIIVYRKPIPEAQPAIVSNNTRYTHPPLEVRGSVWDENNNPIEGATVILTGTSIGCQTDSAGKFSIKITGAKKPVLSISYIGMKTQAVDAKDKNNIRVFLEKADRENEDMVVVGYGRQVKKDIVTAVSTIKATEIMQENATNLGNALQGKVNGAIIISRSGTPGNNRPYIMIRGDNPTYAPLIVIDGVPRYQDISNTTPAPGLILNGLTLDDINPDEVESVTILKDNAATSVYGTRGAGGVMLIETKRGKIGKPQLGFSTSYSMDQPSRFPKLLDAYHYALAVNENAANSEYPVTYNDSILNVIRYHLDPYTYGNLDLYSLLVNRHANVLLNSLSISGGTEQVRYYINGGMMDQGGLINAYNYKRYNVQSNLDIKLTNELKLAVNTGFINTVMNGVSPAGGGSSSTALFSALLLNNPVTPVYNKDRSFYATGPNGNLVADFNPDLSGYQRNTGNNITAQANLQYAPAFLNGLTFRLNTNVDYNTASYIVLNKYYDAYVPDATSSTRYRKTSGTSGYSAPLSNNYRVTQGRSPAYNMDYGLDYLKKIKLNTIAVTALGTYYYNTFNQVTAYRDGIVDGIGSINLGRSLNQQTGGFTSESGRVGGVLRTSYNYAGKHYAEYSMRADASDNFPPGHKWGYFPGAALAWRLNQENFVKDALPFVDDLKFRYSVGQTGIDQTSPYNYFYRYTVATTGTNGGGGYAFGGTYQPSLILNNAYVPNPDLTWGRSLMQNIGMDFGLMKGLLFGTIDFYKKDLSHLQVALNSTTPATFGIGGPYFNLGKEYYSGFEASLGNNLRLGKDMSLLTTFNFTYTYSRVVDYGEAASTPLWQKKQGHAIAAGSYYMAIGLFQTQDEINKYPVIQDGNNNSTIKPGYIKYAALNGDGVLSDKDRVWYNNINLPPYSWGLNMTYRYKNFSANVFFQGAGGNRIQFVPGDYTQYGYANSWRPTNTGTLYPIISNSGQSNNSPFIRPNTLYLRKGDYMRFKNLRLAYDVSGALLRKVGLSKLTLSAAALNLATLSAIKDIDPEANDVDINSGGYYPVQRNYCIGATIGF